jgi:hypothetical protein
MSNADIKNSPDRFHFREGREVQDAEQRTEKAESFAGVDFVLLIASENGTKPTRSAILSTVPRRFQSHILEFQKTPVALELSASMALRRGATSVVP